jgi:hypothetical protein
MEPGRLVVLHSIVRIDLSLNSGKGNTGHGVSNCHFLIHFIRRLFGYAIWVVQAIEGDKTSRCLMDKAEFRI